MVFHWCNPQLNAVTPAPHPGLQVALRRPRGKGWQFAGPCEFVRFPLAGCRSYPCPCWQHCQVVSHNLRHAGMSSTLPAYQHCCVHILALSSILKLFEDRKKTEPKDTFANTCPSNIHSARDSACEYMIRNSVLHSFALA